MCSNGRYLNYPKNPLTNEFVLPRRTLARLNQRKPRKANSLSQDLAEVQFEDVCEQDSDISETESIDRCDNDPLGFTDIRVYATNESYDSSDAELMDTGTKPPLDAEELAFLFLNLQSWRKFHCTKQKLESDLRTNALLLKRINKDSAYPRSIHLLKKIFWNPNEYPLSVHYICKDHGLLLGATLLGESSAYTYPCRYEPEEIHYVQSDFATSMLCGSLEHQISRLVRKYRNDVVDGLRRRNSEGQPEQLEDIADGSYLQRLKTSLEPHDLTLVVHSDGAAVAISSNAKAYAVHFSIAELPADIRASVAVCHTLWIGDNDHMPHRSTLLNPFLEQLTKLSEDGLLLSLFGEPERIRVYVVLWVADSQERFYLAGLSIFHSLFGCTMCEATTEVWKDPKNRKSHHSFYPLSTLNADRHKDSVMMNLAETLMLYTAEERETVRLDPYYLGVTERSVLASLRKFHLVDGLVPDLMHLFFKGLVPKTYDACPRLKQCVRETDSRKRALDVSSAFKHRLRSSKDSSKFKANEWRDDLFIAPYLFHDLLPRRQFDIWCLLYSVCVYATKNSLSATEIDEIEVRIHQLIVLFAEEFGDGFLVYNVHQLVHLPVTCRKFGPMSGYNAFTFENFIGVAMRNVKGYNRIVREIGNTQVLCQITESIADTLKDRTLPDDLALEVARLAHTIYHTSARSVSGGIVFGSPTSADCLWQTNREGFTALRTFLVQRYGTDVSLTTGLIYPCVMVKRYRITTKQSRTDGDANSLIYSGNDALRVCSIVLYHNGNNEPECVLICQTCNSSAETPYDAICFLPGMQLIQWQNFYTAIPLCEFSGVMIQMPYDGEWNLVSKLPRTLFQID